MDQKIIDELAGIKESFKKDSILKIDANIIDIEKGKIPVLSVVYILGSVTISVEVAIVLIIK